MTIDFVPSILKGNPHCEHNESALEGQMVKILECQHGKQAVVRAGKVLSERNLVRDQSYGRYDYTADQAFDIAHDWRDSHNYPQWRVRIELGNMARKVDAGATCASRLKRMSSIRAKLRKNVSLYQMQDIAGCRAIVETIEDVRALVSRYQDGASKHILVDEDDYLSRPKLDGYRSHHLVMKLGDHPQSERFSRNTVEIQIRSRLQHSWATAVEVIDLITGQNLKGGVGDDDWKRFFSLVSSLFADHEDCEGVEGTPDSFEEAKSEIIELEAKLEVTKRLEKFKNAVKYIEENYYFGTHSKIFLLQYDLESNSVTVRTYGELSFDRSIYGNEEREHPDVNTVLVNVEDAENLMAAYPNYFMDVGYFLGRLRVITHGTKLEPVKILNIDWLKNAFKPKSPN